MTVVVVTWNGAHLLHPCLTSLRAQTVAHRVVVVDNASTDETAELLATRYADVEVVRLPTNTGFAGGAQAGLDAVATEYTSFLNNDAQAEPGWLAALQDALDRCPDVVATTSQILLAENGRINNAGGALTRGGSGYDRGYGQRPSDRFAQSADVAAFCGAAAAIRTAAARQVGGFPADFFLYYEDTDLSWRLGRAGGRIRYVPDAVVHHLHSATSDQASEAFAFFNQRNQLLTLVRNAPWLTVVGAVGRYMAVTAVRAVSGGGRSRAHQSRPGHRLRVVRAVAAGLPAAVRVRRETNRTAVISARDFARQWLGTEAR
jgi:GT2 family glycosyltransferase